MDVEGDVEGDVVLTVLRDTSEGETTFVVDDLQKTPVYVHADAYPPVPPIPEWSAPSLEVGTDSGSGGYTGGGQWT